MSKTKKLKLGLPKGSLQESTIELFKKAGIRIVSSSRSYFPYCDDEELEIMLVRSQEMAKYVEQGVFDAGLTGYDWICESGAKVIEIGELVYAKNGFRPVRWVLAVPENSSIKKIQDLDGKRIATELVNFTTKYFKEKNVNVNVEFSWGATEAKTPSLVDGIVELTETGNSLKANKLKIIDELLQSTTRFIANEDSLKDQWKIEKIENLMLLLKGALAAESLVGLKLNIHKNNLNKVTELLKGLRKPTISPLQDEAWVAIEVIIDEKELKKLIPHLKKVGAEGIIEYSLNKVIF
ncbi:MAG: ATP phosphoribosyltransferase [Elusimicrobiota bacterium]|nr:ATP phosphoribosyltransferase [Elusimicrobiota bacterium]